MGLGDGKKSSVLKFLFVSIFFFRLKIDFHWKIERIILMGKFIYDVVTDKCSGNMSRPLSTLLH